MTSSPTTPRSRAMKKTSTPATRNATPKAPAPMKRAPVTTKDEGEKSEEKKVHEEVEQPEKKFHEKKDHSLETADETTVLMNYLGLYLNSLYVVLAVSLCFVTFTTVASAGLLGENFGLSTLKFYSPSSGLSVAEHLRFGKWTRATSKKPQLMPLHVALTNNPCTGASSNSKQNSSSEASFNVEVREDLLPSLIARAHIDADELVRRVYRPLRATHSALLRVPNNSDLLLKKGMKRKLRQILGEGGVGGGPMGARVSFGGELEGVEIEIELPEDDANAHEMMGHKVRMAYEQAKTAVVEKKTNMGLTKKENATSSANLSEEEASSDNNSSSANLEEEEEEGPSSSSSSENKALSKMSAGAGKKILSPTQLRNLVHDLEDTLKKVWRTVAEQRQQQCESSLSTSVGKTSINNNSTPYLLDANIFFDTESHEIVLVYGKDLFEVRLSKDSLKKKVSKLTISPRQVQSKNSTKKKNFFSLFDFQLVFQRENGVTKVVSKTPVEGLEKYLTKLEKAGEGKKAEKFRQKVEQISKNSEVLGEL